MRAFLFLLLFGVSVNVCAFTVQGNKFETTSAEYGLGALSTEFNIAFSDAMNIWNKSTGFNFTAHTSAVTDPCVLSTQDGRHAVAFATTVCGENFGEDLAVTEIVSFGKINSYAHVTFNEDNVWSVYDGALKFDENGNAIIDFRRVAVHELGHAMGIDHEESVSSIMEARYSGDVTTPTQDDINGIHEVYPSLTGQGEVIVVKETQSEPAPSSSENTNNEESGGGGGGSFHPLMMCLILFSSLIMKRPRKLNKI